MPDYLIKENTLTNIANAIRTKTGTTETINPDSMDDKINSIIDLASGTADATATAQDMAQGTTAYVDGELIEGELPVVNKYYNANFILNGVYDGHPESQNGAFENGLPAYAEFTVDKRTIVDPSYYFLELPLDNFGNATTADVRSGKTFTGSDGLCKTGTMSGGQYLRTTKTGSNSTLLTVPCTFEPHFIVVWPYTKTRVANARIDLIIDCVGGYYQGNYFDSSGNGMQDRYKAVEHTSSPSNYECCYWWNGSTLSIWTYNGLGGAPWSSSITYQILVG